ncbi:MAG: asparagine synthase (glutamine-hydrolyzing), partial [Acidobacteria bacterium]|nr:asparagine synthase (glutamine-hydrolyzing) [Acidobacteriota bacterium]
ASFRSSSTTRRRRRAWSRRTGCGSRGSGLIYTSTDGFFIFASEVKAIFEHPLVSREVDLTGLDQVISFPGLVSPRTAFKNVLSLKSGHYLSIDDAEISLKEYWDLDYPCVGEISYDKPEVYYAERVEELLTQSVRYRLQADVPVGFYLSGGLDSSLIAVTINKVSPDIRRHSFSIGFADRTINETPYQKIVAERVGSTHHEIIFDWAEISERMEKMVYHSECPVKETYNTCSIALSEASRNSGVPVILSGEGADELFAGYVGYRFDRSGARRASSSALESQLEGELRGKLWGSKDLFYESDFYALREVKEALYSILVNRELNNFECVNFETINKERLHGRHFVHQRSYLDLKLRLADHLLSDHGDRMALANSVEARFPFLDVELVEFAREIPPDLKLNGFTEKYILKRVAEGKLPHEIIHREKFGFRAPGSPYLIQQGVEWINDMLSYERIKRQGYFNPDFVARLKAQYARPGAGLHPHLETDLLMVVLSFGILLDQFQLPSLN